MHKPKLIAQKLGLSLVLIFGLVSILGKFPGKPGFTLEQPTAAMTGEFLAGAFPHTGDYHLARTGWSMIDRNNNEHFINTEFGFIPDSTSPVPLESSGIGFAIGVNQPLDHHKSIIWAVHVLEYTLPTPSGDVSISWEAKLEAKFPNGICYRGGGTHLPCADEGEDHNMIHLFAINDPTGFMRVHQPRAILDAIFSHVSDPNNPRETLLSVPKSQSYKRTLRKEFNANQNSTPKVYVGVLIALGRTTEGLACTGNCSYLLNFPDKHTFIEDGLFLVKGNGIGVTITPR